MMVELVLLGSALDIGLHNHFGFVIMAIGTFIGVYLAIECLIEIFKEITSGLPQQ